MARRGRRRRLEAVVEAVDMLADQVPTLLDTLQDHDPNEFLILTAP